MSIRAVCVGLFALLLIGMHAQAAASCDISGSNVMFQGIEKRDATSTRSQALDPVIQRPVQSKAAPQATSPAPAPKLEQPGDGAKPAVLRSN